MIEVMNVRQELYVIVNLISITYNLIYFGHTHNIFSDSLTDKNTTPAPISFTSYNLFRVKSYQSVVLKLYK